MDNMKFIHASIEDQIERAIRQDIPIYTKFFNRSEQNYIEQFLSRTDDIVYKVFGGYDQAERCIFAIYNPFVDYDISGYMPIEVLRIEWPSQYNQIGHRDILGSILGLGIKREVIGDIIVGDSMAYAFVIEEMSHYIVQNLVKIGNASVKVECLDIGEVDIKAPTPESIMAVVASLRLDCIVGAGFGLSRTKSLALVKSGRVMLNWEVCVKPSQSIESGDIITIRGMGRVRYLDIVRRTRKDRLSIEIERYM